MTDPTIQQHSTGGAQKGTSSLGAGGRWSVAIVVTVVVHGAAFFLLGIPTPRDRHAEALSSVVRWVGNEPSTAGTLLGERLTLFDNAPLFLPTQWNAANADLVIGGGRAPGEIFDLLEPKLTVSGEKGPELLVLLPTALETPVVGLQKIEWGTASVFGRIDRPVAETSRRLARIEVRANTGGEVLIARDVNAGDDVTSVNWPDWAPFEVMVVVDPVAGAQPPLLVPRGSGSGVVDAYFRDYVRRNLRLDLLLPPGYYRVVIGP